MVLMRELIDSVLAYSVSSLIKRVGNEKCQRIRGNMILFVFIFCSYDKFFLIILSNDQQEELFINNYLVSVVQWLACWN